MFLLTCFMIFAGCKTVRFRCFKSSSSQVTRKILRDVLSEPIFVTLRERFQMVSLDSAAALVSATSLATF